MLFFKQVMDEKLKEVGFREFYGTECHICSITMQVIASLEDKKEGLSGILDTLHISQQAYEELKDGENCNPEQVHRLCSYLGLQEPRLFENCPKLK